MRRCIVRLAAMAALLMTLALPVHAFDSPVQSAGVWNGECSIAASPDDPRHLVVAWMKAGSGLTINVVVSRSLDGGATWSTPIVMPHTEPGYTSADPTLAFGPNGRLYLGFVDFDVRPRGAGGGIDYVSRSTDGGLTWGAPVAALASTATPDRPIDRPWLVVDRTNGPLRGRVYLVSKTANPGPDGHWHVWATSSGDQGATWSAPHRVDPVITGGPLVPAFGMPALAADGRLWVLYSSIDPAATPPARLIAAVGSDTAQSFAAHVVAELPSTAFFTADTLQRFTYALAAHPRDPARIIAVWSDARAGDADIVSSHSANSGLDWSVPLRINDDASGTGVIQDMPWCGTDASGRLAVGWRDRRLGGPGTAAGFDLYGAVSADGGASFGPNLRISQSTSPALFNTTGVDFLGVALADTLLLAAWTSDVVPPYTVRVGGVSVAAQLVAVPGPGGASPARLRTVGIAGARIRVQLSRALQTGDVFALRDVTGRRIGVRVTMSSGYVELEPHTTLAAGLYFVEWHSPAGVQFAKAIVLH